MTTTVLKVTTVPAAAPRFRNCTHRRLCSVHAPEPMELPLAVARAFVKDMRAFLVEKNTIKRDEIAAVRRCLRESPIRAV
jgi:hypothetical protein